MGVQLQDSIEFEIEKHKAIKKINSESLWDAIATGFALSAFVSLFPPFANILQTTYKGIELIPSAVEKVDDAISAVVPKLSKTPKKGDKIAGYTVTSPFGYRGDIGIPGASKDHKGIDLATPIGTPLYAIARKDQTVEVRCWQDKNGGGLVASFVTGDGIAVDYLHLSKCDSGKTQGGNLIARTGDSGVGAAHLHFQQRNEAGEKVPPQKGLIWWALTGQEPKPLLSR